MNPENSKATDGMINHRIIGGYEAPKGGYPWFTWAGGCGGALISKRFVLTAAHCEDVFADRVIVGLLCQNDDNCGQNIEVISVEEKILHPHYTLEPNGPPRYDFLLIRLEEESSIPPLLIDESDSLLYSSGKSLWVMGFGDTKEDDTVEEYPDRLLHVEVGYVPSSICNRQYVGLIDDTMLCAADTMQDACQGDSGGKLQFHSL